MRRFLLPLSAALLASLPLADQIVRTDGKVVKDVHVVEEGLTTVSYKKGSNVQTVPAEEVLSITYDRKPRLVDEADQALKDDDPIGARDTFDTYVDGQIAKPNEREKWAPAYAAWRSVQVSQLLDDVDGVIQRADRLIRSFADSRYVPEAYLAKASAQARKGNQDAAQATLKSFESLVASKSLSKRWAMEAKLGLVLVDPGLAPAARREKLEGVVSEAAGTYPTVASRAQVGVGETYLAQIDAAKEDQKLKLAGDARAVFERITKDQQADEATLAAAFTGLGLAQFHQSGLSRDKTLAREALVNFLRVPVLYQEQSQYVAQSMYYAMLSFRALEDEQSILRSREMRYKLMQRYPESGWAKQAKASY